MTNAAKKVIDDLGRVRAFAQTMLDCNTDSPNVHEMVRDAADNAIAFLKSQERYIEDMEQGVPVAALKTLSERVKELEAMQKARVMTLEEVRSLHESSPVWLEDVDKKHIVGGLFVKDYAGTRCFDFVVARDWNDVRITADYSDYGIRWRCWTSCPDDETRGATPWED